VYVAATESTVNHTREDVPLATQAPSVWEDGPPKWYERIAQTQLGDPLYVAFVCWNSDVRLRIGTTINLLDKRLTQWIFAAPPFLKKDWALAELRS
jgi:hypothetical protein